VVLELTCSTGEPGGGGAGMPRAASRRLGTTSDQWVLVNLT
jgi:hypothetical protein